MHFIHPKLENYCQHGPQTHNPEIKSLMLYWLSLPGWLQPIEAVSLG